MEIIQTIEVKMSQKEKEAFDTVMNSLDEFCTKMRSLQEIDEETDYLYTCAREALAYLDDFKRP